jgi:GNAT superfamily N-acetyltransferase
MKNVKIVCRRLSSGDFSDVAGLFQELANDEALQVDHIQYERVLSNQSTQVFGAVQGSKIVSMATLHLLPNLTPTRPIYGLIENVVTLKAFQNSGFGRAVVDHIIDAAWAAGAYKIMLLTGVQSDAKDFYLKCGFSSDSKHGMEMRRVPVRNSHRLNLP